jgi:hypothetical protein
MRVAIAAEKTASSGRRIPLSRPASAISGLTVEPGGPPPSTLRLNKGRDGFSISAL